MSVRLLHKYPLLNKMVGCVFLFALVVAILTSVGNYWFASRMMVRESEEALVRLQHSQLSSLTNSIWNFNRKAVEIQLQSILTLPYVAGVRLKYDDGDVFSYGITSDDRMPNRSFPLLYSHHGAKSNLGNITFFIDEKSIRARVFRDMILALATEILGLLLTCVFLVSLFMALFNRHLNKIASYAQTLEIDKMDKPLSLRREQRVHLLGKGDDDELDRIVKALNDMRLRLREGLRFRQEAEKLVLEEKNFSDTLMNSLPMLFFVIDEEVRPVRYNNLFKERIGGDPEEIKHLNILSRIHSQDRNILMAAIEKAFNEETMVEVEARLVSKDGEVRPYFMIGNHLNNGDKRYLICLGLDISEKKQLEEELRQAQKMEAIGTLAGGIAHDFNNILSAIFGNCQLAQLKLEKNSGASENIQGILMASTRAKELVGQILTFSRKRGQEKKALQPFLVVKEALKLLRSSIPTTIEIKQDISSKAYILADPTQIHQVIMNLCTNAYQAMREKGGIMEVRLCDVENSEDNSSFPGDMAGGKYVQLMVSDTGSGMDGLTKAKIFEPYFTTKELGEGTGLGLAVVHGIVQNHKGRITVESDYGQGTIFKIWFPVFENGSAAQQSDISELEELPGGNEKIMVVDDDHDILEMRKALLSEYGYRVMVFSDGIHALDFLYKNPQGVDMVLTDLTMPGITGFEMGKRMLSLRPDLPILLCTGYTDIVNGEDVSGAGFKGFLQKPVDISELLAKIRQVIDKNKKI